MVLFAIEVQLHRRTGDQQTHKHTARPSQSFYRNTRPRCRMYRRWAQKVGTEGGHRRWCACASAQPESTSRGRMKRHHANLSSPASVGFGPLLFSNTDGPSSEPWRLQSERQACVFDVFRTRSKMGQPWQLDVPAAATCQCLNLADRARSWWFNRPPSLLLALSACGTLHSDDGIQARTSCRQPLSPRERS